MTRTPRTILSVVAIGATAAAGITALSAPAQASQDSVTAYPGVHRIIVGYKNQPSDAAVADNVRGKRAGLSLQRRLGTGDALVAVEGSVDRAIAALRNDPSVAYVEPDVLMQATAVPNDTEYNRQWDLYETKAGMNVPGAWTTSTGKGVTVAVIDTGYVAHSDLASQVVKGYDFISDSSNAKDGNGRDADSADPGDSAKRGDCGTDVNGNPVPAADTQSSWHGTHVAGTIAAATNNSKGVAGIAYDAKIQPVRVLGKCGGYTSDIADAITWASGGTVRNVPANSTPAKVINMSLGGKAACGSAYQNAINGAVQRGTTVVVAAGNSNTDVSGFTPANCNNVIAVAATNRDGSRAFYSNYGSKVDVAAPGGEVRRSTDAPGTITTPENGIWSTLNSGATTASTENYEPYMGTSMAAPHIAGLAALLLGKKSTLTPAQIETLIKNNARAFPGTCGQCGSGLADATKTVNAA